MISVKRFFNEKEERILQVKAGGKIFSAKIDNRSEEDNKTLEKLFDYFLVKLDSLARGGGKGWAS